MNAVLSADAMRSADAATIDDFGIPGFTLMESAGRESATIIEQLADRRSDKILCCCGTGNNGGDGLVVARTLYARGFDVEVLLVGDQERETPSVALNRHLLEQLAAVTLERSGNNNHRLQISRISTTADLNAEVSLNKIVDFFERSNCTWIVDALLGTGAQGPIREPIATAVNCINEHPGRVVALDVPSGLSGDRGTTVTGAVAADYTVCMAALKPGILLNDGPVHSGTVSVVEIGIPPFILRDRAKDKSSGVQPIAADVLALLPKRNQNAHKYSSGTLVVVAGSPGLTGAPVLASESALRVGAGAVILATRQSVHDIVARKVVEIMTVGLPESEAGVKSSDARTALSPTLERTDALVVGCGFGREPDTAEFICELLETVKKPIVVDADALFAIRVDPKIVREYSNGKWVLTPHRREFERLVGAAVDWTDRAKLASQYSDAWNCVLVLKGNPTVIGIPGEPTVFCPAGNSLLATAGTGDVLAGMIGGFLAQGLSAGNAAIVGTFLGGVVADRYLSEYGGATLIASDIIRMVPQVLASLYRGNDLQQRILITGHSSDLQQELDDASESSTIPE